MSLLEARDLAKQFKKRQVVNGVSISVSPGEIVGLLGPNGAGKTTTFNMIVGLVKPDDGEVVFEGNTIVSKPMHARARLGIGYLTQEPSVFRKLTVEQNILAILETCTRDKVEQKARLKSLLEELDLTSLAKSKAYTLSGGENVDWKSPGHWSPLPGCYFWMSRLVALIPLQCTRFRKF